MFGDPLRHDEVEGAVAGGPGNVREELQHGLQLRVEQLGVHHHQGLKQNKVVIY